MRKGDLKKGWDELTKLAWQHRGANDRFTILCEQYYGIAWYLLPSLTDHDPIIDTIDYGIDTLSYDQFDKLVLEAIKERDAAQEGGV